VFPELIIAQPPFHTLFPLLFVFHFSFRDLVSVGATDGVVVRFEPLDPTYHPLPIRISITSKKYNQNWHKSSLQYRCCNHNQTLNYVLLKYFHQLSRAYILIVLFAFCLPALLFDYTTSPYV